MSLENAPYEKAQKVGSLALQLLCDAIVRAKGKGYETPLLDVFRQVVTTRNKDGQQVSIALVIQDSEEANYWCTGSFIALSDGVSRIDPGENITFGELRVPFLMIPATRKLNMSGINKVFSELTTGIAINGDVSSELVANLGRYSADFSFLISPQVPKKEQQILEARLGALSPVVPKVIPQPAVERTGYRKPDFNRSSDLGSKVRPEATVPVDVTKPGIVILPEVDKASAIPKSSKSSAVDARRFDPPVGSTVAGADEWEDVASRKPGIKSNEEGSEKKAGEDNSGNPKGNPVSRFLRSIFGGR